MSACITAVTTETAVRTPTTAVTLPSQYSNLLTQPRLSAIHIFFHSPLPPPLFSPPPLLLLLLPSTTYYTTTVLLPLLLRLLLLLLSQLHTATTYRCRCHDPPSVRLNRLRAVHCPHRDRERTIGERSYPLPY